jgi:hemoglobin-like flavoprotein
MDDNTKTLVQGSWAKVAPSADEAAKIFYGRLFELDPKLQTLFPQDLTEQRKKLMGTLTVAVKGLDDLGKLIPILQHLGQRHRGYGVEDADYDTVGSALLWALGEGLGDAFTDDVREAWVEVYGVMATTMKEAAAAA